MTAMETAAAALAFVVPAWIVLLSVATLLLHSHFWSGWLVH